MVLNQSITLLLFSIIIYTLLEGVIFLSKKFGYYDKPDGVLKVHKSNTPKSGGLYFFIALFIIVFFFPSKGSQNYFEDISIITVVIYGAYNLIIGVLDDSLRFLPQKKLILQAGVSAIAIIILYFQSNTSIPVYILFLLFILLIFNTNSLNIIDHYNGLSTLSYLYSVIFMNYLYPSKILIQSNILLFLVFGFFLINNLRSKGNSRIFQGNGGSHFFGGLLSIAFVKILLETADLYHFFAVLITGVIIFLPTLIDTTQVIFTRFLFGLNPLKGSNHHISHVIDSYTKGNVYYTIGILFTVIITYSTVFLYLDYLGKRFEGIIFVLIAYLVTVITFIYLNKKLQKRNLND